MTLAVLPAGVATAIYLSEYANPGSRLTRLVRVAVNNLAGVPSIVFGLFGLGFFVQFVGAGIDRALYGGQRVFGQPALVWAALTMAVLTLPVVIVATEEACPLSARVAPGIRGAGASRLQTIVRVVLPQALPGILTGAILASAAALARSRPSCSLAWPISCRNCREACTTNSCSLAITSMFCPRSRLTWMPRGPSCTPQCWCCCC